MGYLQQKLVGEKLMKKQYKKVVLIILFLIISGLVLVIYKRTAFQQQYIKELRQQKDKYITSFYKSDFNGIITYIKRYEENPDQYVITIKMFNQNEKTIGKVEITNFSSVQEGDTIRKKPNTFELEVSNRRGKMLSVVKYQKGGY
ncbi:MAG: hypothetical protein EOP45_02475 [Sphingobacteriaceae bacterium]|nr:MAG: hypothetical protein EOP45_02475 [Sphingobacteriaceae bacterium]